MVALANRKKQLQIGKMLNYMLGKDPMKNKRTAKHNRAENTSRRHTDTERESLLVKSSEGLAYLKQDLRGI